MASLLAENLQHVAYLDILRGVEYLSQQSLPVEVGSLAEVSEEILGVKDPLDGVDPLVVYRYAGVAALLHEGQHLRIGCGELDGCDVDPRCHHLGDGLALEEQDLIEHPLLLAVLRGQLDRFAEIFPIQLGLVFRQRAGDRLSHPDESLIDPLECAIEGEERRDVASCHTQRIHLRGDLRDDLPDQ